MIEETFTAGYNWCVDTIKMSQHSQLANDLEINKAVMYLKQKGGGLRFAFGNFDLCRQKKASNVTKACNHPLNFRTLPTPPTP